MTKVLDKKDWVCTQPFEFAEIFDHKMFMCCPNWLPENLGNPNNILENFKSEKAEAIRKSVADGSYTYCIESRCPKLTGLKQGKTQGFISKQEYIRRIDFFEKAYPHQLKFNFDQSCNLKCPSCRLQFINYEGKQRERTEELIINIEEQVGNILTHIECTGSGDPFFSRTFRKWMMRFDPTKYPNLQSIHLHTNGTLWNESNWVRMKNVHKYVKSCEISIDAATKDTYENHTRIGGKWDKLMENLDYIATIPNLYTIHCSFVVQQQNYHEMKDFFYLIGEKFSGKNKRWNVFFSRMLNWGHWSVEEYNSFDVVNPKHPEHQNFIKAFKDLPHDALNLRHNLTFDDLNTNDAWK